MKKIHAIKPLANGEWKNVAAWRFPVGGVGFKNINIAKFSIDNRYLFDQTQEYS